MVLVYDFDIVLIYTVNKTTRRSSLPYTIQANSLLSFDISEGASDIGYLPNFINEAGRFVNDVAVFSIVPDSM